MSFVTCGKCAADGFFERRWATCAGCGRKTELCPECWPTYVCCSEVCRKRWRAEAVEILGLPLTPSGKPKDPKPDDPQRRLW